MKSIINFKVCCLFLLLIISVTVSKAQQSVNTVKYKITYNSATQVYTTWVVPDYSVPNSNNTGTTEFGGTAQFTIVVPKDFVITSITDINGVWTKVNDSAFRKLGPGQPGQVWTGLDPAFNYYVIGKSPSETNYGSFTVGTPVALFSFKGNSCYGALKPIAPNDPFITAADNAYGLNLANSFYSRSAQPSGGNQKPLEQFKDITGVPANCLPLEAKPDNGTTAAGNAITMSVLSNDTKGGSPVIATEVTLTINQNPTNGTVVVNADGSIKYTPNVGFTGKDCYIYRICDKLSSSLCDTANVCVNVTNGRSNLKVTKTLIGNTKIMALNSIVSYSIKVENLGPDNATNVVLKDSLGAGLQYFSNATSKGTYSNPLWSIPTLNNGEIATLTISAKAISEGVSFNFAKIQSADQLDLNTTNNEDRACISVPIKICSGEKIEATVPAQYTNVTWFNGLTVVGTGNSLIISQAGSYTFQASNSQCPAGGCCPIVVEEGNCCSPNICVPFSVVKIKSLK
jgi:uncharacterized repeat protein (TIGR01451 family)